jgi:hypothetical protein
MPRASRAVARAERIALGGLMSLLALALERRLRKLRARAAKGETESA